MFIKRQCSLHKKFTLKAFPAVIFHRKGFTRTFNFPDFFMSWKPQKFSLSLYLDRRDLLSMNSEALKKSAYTHWTSGKLCFWQTRRKTFTSQLSSKNFSFQLFSEEKKLPNDINYTGAASYLKRVMTYIIIKKIKIYFCRELVGQNHKLTFDAFRAPKHFVAILLGGWFWKPLAYIRTHSSLFLFSYTQNQSLSTFLPLFLSAPLWVRKFFRWNFFCGCCSKHCLNANG